MQYVRITSAEGELIQNAFTIVSVTISPIFGRSRLTTKGNDVLDLIFLMPFLNCVEEYASAPSMPIPPAFDTAATRSMVDGPDIPARIMGNFIFNKLQSLLVLWKLIIKRLK